MKNKITILTTLISLLVTQLGVVMPINSFASDVNMEEYSSNYTEENYNISDGVELYAAGNWYGDLCFDESTGTITACNQSAEGVITIPEQINGVTVTAIGDIAFKRCFYVTEIIIPDTILSVGEEAFRYTAIENIVLPSSLKSVDGSAFISCESLKNISIPSTNQCFCSENGVLFDKAKSKIIKYPQNKEDDNYSIPANVKSVGSYAFAYCSKLKEISIPQSVSEIGEYSFFYCSLLESIKLPQAVTKIPKQSFDRCTSMSNAILSDETEEIGTSAFASCTALKTIELPNSLHTIMYAAFSGCTSLEDISIPNAVSELPNYVFSSCSSLKNIKLSDNLRTIGNDTFYKCEAIENITLPNTLEMLGSRAFASCFALKEITLPANVELSTSVFSTCKNLEKATISASVTQIGDYAFINCTKLTIYGEKGSVAEIYANNNKIPFVIIGSSEQAGIPTASIRSGDINKDTEITLTSATEGADIYYTIDGKTPNMYSTKYTAPIIVKNSFTLKAVAVKDGYLDSDIAAYEYNALPYQYTISYDANGGNAAPQNQIKIENETTELSNITPTRQDYVFVGWARTKDAKTAEFSAGSEYKENADICLYAVWRLAAVSDLSISAEDQIGGKKITISSPMSGVSIYYTMDGSEPNESSTKYSRPISINEAGNFTIKAVGIRASYDNSAVAKFTVTVEKAPAPIISYDGTNITIYSPLKDGEIHYTTSASSAPTAYSTKYTMPFSTSSVSAIVVKSGYASSEIERFEVQKSIPKVITPQAIEKVRTEYIVESQRTDNIAFEYYKKPYYSETDKQKQIDELSSAITSGLSTDYDKLYMLHKWVISNILYDFDYGRAIDSGTVDDTNRGVIDPIQVLEKGKTVCDGYARLMEALARSAGIPCRYLDGLNHAWNTAYADGRWLVFDTTNNKFDIDLSYWGSNAYIDRGNETPSLYSTDNISYSVINFDSEYISEGIAANNSKITKINMSNNVKVIGPYAFANCTNLKEVIIPDSVEYIGAGAFAGCNNLEKVILGGGVKIIDDGAFKYCKSLKNIIIPHSVTHTGYGIFGYCSSLKTADISSLKSINNDTFIYCESLENVTLGRELKEIGSYAFSRCNGLKNVELPYKLEKIGYGAFAGDNVKIYVNGNAPECGVNYSGNTSLEFGRNATVYYYKNAAGFDESPWADVNCIKLNTNMPEYVSNKCDFNAECVSMDDGLTFNIDLTSYNLYNDITAFCAIYDDKGSLVRISSYVVPNEATINVAAKLTKQEIKEQNMAKLKIFVWNRLNGLEPITEIYQRSI